MALDLTKLENCLMNWTGIEKQMLYLQAMSTLDNYGNTTAWSEISAMLEYTTDTSVNDVIFSIHQIIDVAVNELLLGLAITPNEESSLQDRIDLLDALKLLENFDDSVMIVGLCQSNEEPREILAAALKEAANYSDDRCIDTAYLVTYSLIDRIEQVHIDKLSMDGLEVSLEEHDTKQYHIAINRIRQFIEQNPNTLLTQAIEEDQLPLLLRDEVVVSRYKENLLNLKDPKQIALNLIGILLTTSLDLITIQSDFSQWVTHLYDDPQLTIQASVHLATILSGIQHAQT